jgi:GT2 family glycosyltransferase
MSAVTLENVSIVVPSYNGARVVRTCLETLEREAPDAEVIIADGGSTDGSVEIIRAFCARLPNMRLLEIPNHGWAHATNRGFEAATREYLVTINTDLFLTRAALLSMRAVLEADATVGAASPVLLNGDGSRQMFFGNLYWPNWVRVEHPLRVHLIYGCCAMIPRRVLERVGLFDEHFFFYNEEFDWAWRAARHGYSFRLVPERVVHLEGGSTPSNANFQLEAQRGGLYLIHKHFPRFASEALRRFAQLTGYVGKQVAPDALHREAWRRIEHIALRGSSAYLESPFPLSGRGEVHLDR